MPIDDDSDLRRFGVFGCGARGIVCQEQEASSVRRHRHLSISGDDKLPLKQLGQGNGDPERFTTVATRFQDLSPTLAIRIPGERHPRNRR